MSDRSPLMPALVKEAFAAGALAAMQELYQFEDGTVGVSDLTDQPLANNPPLIVAQVRLLREPSGVLSIAASADVAFRLAQRYLPTESKITDDLVDDCLGELANVIAGQGKTALKGTPYHFMLSTPVVARPAELPNAPSQAWRCSITSEAGTFAVVVDLP
jgi:CheY-specific phosphatase CheX